VFAGRVEEKNSGPCVLAWIAVMTATTDSNRSAWVEPWPGGLPPGEWRPTYITLYPWTQVVGNVRLRPGAVFEISSRQAN